MQIVLDDILLNYEVVGKGKNTILILPGWGQNISHWTEIAEDLSNKYKVVSLDLPGFGGSTPPPKPYSVTDYSNIVREFLEKLSIKKPIIIGHSFGGKVAIDLSSKDTIAKKLFLISPSGINFPSLLTIVKIGFSKIIKILLFWLPNKLKGHLLNILASEDYKNANELKSTFKKVVSQNVRSQAQKIKTPTVVIWGEKDSQLKVRHAKVLKKLIKNSTLRILWDQGHSPNIYAADKLVNLLKEYL